MTWCIMMGYGFGAPFLKTWNLHSFAFTMFIIGAICPSGSGDDDSALRPSIIPHFLLRYRATSLFSRASMKTKCASTPSRSFSAAAVA